MTIDRYDIATYFMYLKIKNINQEREIYYTFTWEMSVLFEKVHVIS